MIFGIGIGLGFDGGLAVADTASVAITGLTSNPTHGPTAQIGVELTATATFSDSDPAGGTWDAPWVVDGVDFKVARYTPQAGDDLSSKTATFTADVTYPPATSAAYTARYAAAINAVAPAVTGDTGYSDVLSVSNGTWTGATGGAYTYQWQRNGVDIIGATSSSYMLDIADSGATIRAIVTYTNSGGAVSATSNEVTADTLTTAAVAADLAISGTTTQGQTLSLTGGAVTGTPTPSVTYQWLRDGSPIGGATSATYTLVLADVGTNISCTKTATNIIGSGSDTADAVGPIAAAPAGPEAVSFGALTLAGAGALAAPSGATGIDSAGGTNLVFSGGEVSPNTGGGVTSGTVTFVGSSVEWTVTAVANKYSCKADTTEIGAAWTAANTATATGILVRDGDATASAMWTPAAKSFTNQFTIEPHSFTPAARPLNNTYTVHLPGLQFQVGTTNNVRLYGLDFFDDQTHGESEAVGVIDVGAGGSTATLTNITIEACEVRSTPMTDNYDADVFYGTAGFVEHATDGALLAAMNIRRGIRANGGALRIIDCYVHDVSRGISGGGSISGGTRSCITGCDIQDVYTNFTTTGYLTNGMDIYDNRMMHAWAVSEDTAQEPHSSVGLSFDASGTAGQLVEDVNVMGNIVHVGYRRKQYTEASGDTYDASNAATGAKFNDPTLDGSNSYSYFNIKFAFNTIVTAGIGIEFSGADSIDIFNNTLVKDTLTATGSAPYLYFQGSSNTRAWNNLTSNKEDLGTADNTGFYVETLSDFEGYGNQFFYDETYFKVDAQTGYPEFDFADLDTAFEPDAGQPALLATQKKGALGTGLYSGNGVHSVTYSPLTAAAGTAHTSNDTVWDGATRASLATGMSDGKQVTFVFEGKCGASTDGTAMYWYGSASNGFRIYRNTDNKVYVSAKEGTATTIILECNSDFTITEADGEFTLAIAVDLATRQVRMLKNGVQDRWMGNPTGAPASSGYNTITDQAMDLSASRRLLSNHTTGTGYWKGQVHTYWLTDEFIDFDIQSELDAVFTSTGAIKDPGSDGSNYTGTAANVCCIGAASTYNGGTANGGTGGAVTAEGGTVTEPSTVNWVWPNGAYSTAAYTSLANASSLVVAFATRNRGARTGSTIPAVVGTSTDTRVLINSSGSVEVRLEDNSSTAITLSSGTTLSADNDIISVLLIVNSGGIDNGGGATGDTVQLWVNGTKTDSTTVTSIPTPKWPRNFQSSGSALYGDGDDSEYAMLWVGEYASGMGWSDFFDGSNLPQPSIGTVEGQAADFYEAGNAASWNAAMTLTGTFQDV